jgi:hypothetical protein
MSKLLSTSAGMMIGIAVLCATGSARADWPWDYGYYGGYNWGFQRYALTNNQMPPYFAMFPPVYYRAPIQARTYGVSPFAYPPCECRHAAVKPEVIENPYVKPDPDAKPMPSPKPKTDAKGKSARVEPLIIVNPYVTPEAPAAVAKR